MGLHLPVVVEATWVLSPWHLRHGQMGHPMEPLMVQTVWLPIIIFQYLAQ
jgi:hypothetical protein